MQIVSRDGLVARRLGSLPRALFPDREFFVRSQGQVRFVKVSGKLQMAAAGVAAALLLGWLVTMATVLFLQFDSAAERRALLAREAKVASAASQVSAWRSSTAGRVENLARRQRFLEAAVEAQVGDLNASEAPVAATATKISANAAPASTPALGLAQIEARQFALAERLTGLADARAARAESAIRRVGLNPRMMMAKLDKNSAQGGPLLALTLKESGGGESIDPRFARLGASLTRMSALERGLSAIPSHLPASLEFISSGFGYRSDPFTGQAALHSGLDFRGPMGAPIHAAADGTVSFAGTKAGYGNCLEISHGNGMVTRYAHMSAFRAHVGQSVAAGDVVGAIGNTGRSTGPHLHFEVRIGDRAVNPRPFLERPGPMEGNRDVLEATKRAGH